MNDPHTFGVFPRHRGGVSVLIPHLDFSSTSGHWMYASLALSCGIGFDPPVDLLAQLYISSIGVHQVHPECFLEIC